MSTYYVVQTYVVNSKRVIQADPPRQVSSQEAAMALAERLAKTKFGVVAFSRSGESASGEWDEAKIFYQFGDFTAEDAEAIRSAA